MKDTALDAATAGRRGSARAEPVKSPIPVCSRRSDGSSTEFVGASSRLPQHCWRWLSPRQSGCSGPVGSGFVDPASDRPGQIRLRPPSYRVDSDVILIYSGSGLVDDPGFEDAIGSVVAGLPANTSIAFDSYYSTKSDRLVSTDQHSTLILLRLVGADEGERLKSYAAIKDDLANPPDGLTVLRRGAIPVSADINQQVENDIKRAELLSFPILLILLAFVIGSWWPPACHYWWVPWPSWAHSHLSDCSPCSRMSRHLPSTSSPCSPSPAGHRLRPASSLMGSAGTPAFADNPGGVEPHAGNRRPDGRVLQHHRDSFAGRIVGLPDRCISGGYRLWAGWPPPGWPRSGR